MTKTNETTNSSTVLHIFLIHFFIHLCFSISLSLSLIHIQCELLLLCSIRLWRCFEDYSRIEQRYFRPFTIALSLTLSTHPNLLFIAIFLFLPIRSHCPCLLLLVANMNCYIVYCLQHITSSSDNQRPCNANARKKAKNSHKHRKHEHG